tara:strand:+ start:11224 stop:12084 length:861 start_codon:yes stop_codon:yes gene_type:complete
MNTTTKTEMLSYKSLKSRLRDNALKSAVGWAKAERMVDGQLKSVKFDFDYMYKVYRASGMAISEGGIAEKKALTELASRDKWVGKTIDVEGKTYQPAISFANQVYQDTEGNVITDLVEIGKARWCQLHKKCGECASDIESLKQQKKLMRWKQKFFRFCYNFNDTEMTKYHDKISEFESEQFDIRSDANIEGREIKVQYHRPSESDSSSITAGMASRDAGIAAETIDDGGQMKEFADSMKTAFDIRVSTIQTITAMLGIPLDKRKALKIPATTTAITETRARVPVLI